MTVPTDPAARGAERRQGGPDPDGIGSWANQVGLGARVAAITTDLPSRLPLMLFWLTLVVSVTILLDAFAAAIVIPAALALIVLSWRWAPDPLHPSRPAVVGAALALAGAVGWVLIGLRYTAEVMLVERDPGFLTLEGLWLSHHPDPDIPIRTAADVLAQIPDARATSDAFWLEGSALTAQGAKAFPGLIATLGWAGGQQAVLAANVVIGGLALLAVYDLGRRLLSPYWALMPMAALGLTTPMLYFTRTPFTEPTNLVVTCTGLAVVWGALRRPRAGHFALAGALLGAPALSRIDGAAVAAGLLLGLGLVAGGSRDPGRRRALVRGFALAGVAALGMVVLGYLDLRVNSSGYLSDHRALYLPLIGLLAACVVIAILAIAVGPRLSGWVAQHRRGLALIAMGGVLVGAVFLASRPLWWEAHRTVPGSGQASFVAALQMSAGVAVDETRSYDEQTMTWLAWYLGVGTVILAAVGAALMVQESIARRRAPLLVVLVTLGVPTLLYLFRPAITPDQIWAMRRFLPAALPLVLLCAVWLLQRAVAWARASGRGGPTSVLVRVIVVLCCLHLLAAPLWTWGGLVVQAEYDGRVQQVDELCGQVAGSRVVVVRGAEPPLLPTLRIACDVDVVEVSAPASAEQLAAIREAWGPGRVLVVAGIPGTVPWPAGAPATSTHDIVRWPHTLRPSTSPIPFRSSLWIGLVEPDGTVTPIPASGAG